MRENNQKQKTESQKKRLGDISPTQVTETVVRNLQKRMRMKGDEVPNVPQKDKQTNSEVEPNFILSKKFRLPEKMCQKLVEKEGRKKIMGSVPGGKIGDKDKMLKSQDYMHNEQLHVEFKDSYGQVRLERINSK